MSLMKSLYIAPALLSLVLSSTMSFAQADSSSTVAQTANKTPPAYGDNPNIFEVLAHKTSDKVVNTAEKVGDATERGVAKVKPKVNQAWENITAKHTVDVPIEQKSLSQSSNNVAAPSSNQSQAQPAVTVDPKPQAEAKTVDAQTPSTTAPETSRPSTVTTPVTQKTPAMPSATPATSTATPTQEAQPQPAKPLPTTLTTAHESQAHPTIVL